MQRLYSLGGRKFVVISINPIGCSPLNKINRPSTQSGCVEDMNSAAQLFNSQVLSFVDDSKQQMPWSTLVFLNSYQILNDILQNPSSKGTYLSTSLYASYLFFLHLYLYLIQLLRVAAYLPTYIYILW